MSKKMSNQQYLSKNKSDKMATETKGFDYETNFKVNYGIFSKDEQARISKARVTIVGLLCLALMIAGAACTNSPPATTVPGPTTTVPGPTTTVPGPTVTVTVTPAPIAAPTITVPGPTITKTVTVTVTATSMPTTTTPTPAGLVPNSLDFSVLDTGSSETALQLAIRPLDENGQLMNVEGELSVKLWAVDLLTDAKGDLIQQWGNVPVTNDSFVKDSGNLVSLEYKDFKPEPEELYYIQLTLTVGGTRVTIERVILLPIPDISGG